MMSGGAPNLVVTSTKGSNPIGELSLDVNNEVMPLGDTSSWRAGQSRSFPLWTITTQINCFSEIYRRG